MTWNYYRAQNLNVISIYGMCYVIFWKWISIFDMNEISKSEVNTLLQMENNLSLALVFVRDHKIKGYMKSVKFNDDGLSY